MSSSLTSMSCMRCPNFLKYTGNTTPLALTYPFRKLVTKHSFSRSDTSLSTSVYVMSAMFMYRDRDTRTHEERRLPMCSSGDRFDENARIVPTPRFLYDVPAEARVLWRGYYSIIYIVVCKQ